MKSEDVGLGLSVYPSSSGQWEHFMHGFSGDAPPHTSSLPPFGRSNSAAATVEYPSPFSGKTSCMGVSVIRVVIHPNTLGMGSGFHFYIRICTSFTKGCLFHK